MTARWRKRLDEARAVLNDAATTAHHVPMTATLRQYHRAWRRYEYALSSARQAHAAYRAHLRHLHTHASRRHRARRPR